MDVLHELQKDLHKQISNAFSNFKKKGAGKMTKVGAQTRLAGLEDSYLQAKTNHKKILSYDDTPQDHGYFTSNLFEQMMDSYFDRKGEFVQFLEDIRVQEQQQNPPVNPPAPINNAVVPSSPVDQHSLPKMNLPKFSGSFSEWENFRDLYRSVVHRRADLNASIKYYYLRTNLFGEAMEQIKGIPITAEQYDRAWNALVNHYDNKRRIVGTLISKILNIKPMKSETVRELKRVSREIFSPLESLIALGRSHSDIGNDIIVHLTVQQFEANTKKDWKKSLDKTNDAPPTIQILRQFIESQLENLDTLNDSHDSSNDSNSRCKASKVKQSKKENESTIAHSLQTAAKVSSGKITRCILCSSEHTLAKCEQFHKKHVSERQDYVKAKRLCFNCLGVSHAKNQCKSRFNCFTCKSRHHTLLHMNGTDSTALTETNLSSTNQAMDQSTMIPSCSNVVVSNQTMSAVHSTQAAGNSTGVLLATAQVCVTGPKNRQVTVKALIDPCSQVSLITQYLCKQLALNQKDAHVCINGIGENSSELANKLANFSLTSHFPSDFSLEIKALVLPKLSSYVPPTIQNAVCFKHLQGLRLADPEYATQTRIDLLLGAGVYADIVEGNIVKGGDFQPIAISTKLGWLLTGKVPATASNSSIQGTNQSLSVLRCSCNHEKNTDLQVFLEEFWRTEEVTVKKNSCSIEEQKCEDLFTNTTYREESGRYVVRLPWKEQGRLKEIKIDNSYSAALRALKRLEANFSKDKRLKSEYSQFMKEYMELGHMTAIEGEILSTDSDYFFLPHHGVWKETSSTTKLRTVFNGSSKLHTGESVNDMLYSGSNLLMLPVDLICQVRHYKIALSADVEKMFRQIKVAEQDRKFQAIIWRYNPCDKITIYLLNTVTYGLTCSSYLAIRTLLQMASDHEREHSIAAKVVCTEIYSDNVLTGAHSTEEALEKVKDLIALFRKAQMNLRKWSSNDLKAISHLSKDLLLTDEVALFASETFVPMLGIA